ncbi:MAG: hypothetical protein ACI9EF_003810 [Pseudohongiellaceae bacterium]|jgi:hypothetical protein
MSSLHVLFHRLSMALLLAAVATPLALSQNLSSLYASTGSTYVIPVVAHILQHGNGSGAVSDASVYSQIDTSTKTSAPSMEATAGGAATNIEFVLASAGPSGNATTGINRYASSKW